MTSTRTYLQVVELWRKDAQSDVLSHADGYYSTNLEFGAISRKIVFPMGRGLIGRCAQLGTPLLLDSLAPDTGFLRSDAARAAGLTVGLALPVNSTDGQPAVLALFFSHYRDRPSAGVEIWEDRDSDGMGLRLGHHGVAEDFRRLSAQTRFQRGQGLPGRVLDSCAPELLDRLDRPRTFLRALAAESAGFVGAVGFPVVAAPTTVVVLLSHQTHPVAQSVELWSSANEADFVLASSQTVATSGASFDRGPLLRRAAHARAPVVFAATPSAGASTAERYGGFVLPFFPRRGGCAACILTW